MLEREIACPTYAPMYVALSFAHTVQPGGCLLFHGTHDVEKAAIFHKSTKDAVKNTPR